MALQTFLDAFNVTTGAIGTTYARTGYGFQPKAFIVWCSKTLSTLDATTGGNTGFCIGFGTSATDRRVCAISSEDAGASSDTNRLQRSDAIFAHIGAVAAIDGLLDVQSVDTDGITFVVDDVFTNTWRVFVLAIGGTDLTNAETVQFQLPTTGTPPFTQDIATLTFQPDCMLFINIGRAVAPPQATSSAGLSIGVAAGTTTADNAALWAHEEDGQATMNGLRYCLDGESVLGWRANPEDVSGRAYVSAWLTNGFTLTYVETPAFATYIFGLALKGGRYKLKTGLTQTDTVTDIAISGAGFQPVAGLVASHCAAKSVAGTPDTHVSFSLGGFTSAVSERAGAMWAENGTANAETAFGMENDAVYIRISAADAIDGIMQTQSVDADGVTFRMADADPTQAFFWTLLIGNTGGVSVSNTAIVNEESLIGRSPGFGSSLESLKGVSVAPAELFESIVGVASVSTQVLESMKGLQTLATELLEAKKSLSTTFAEAIEAQVAPLFSSTDSYESLKGVAQLSSPYMEALAGVPSLRVLNLEARGSVAVNVEAIVPIESLFDSRSSKVLSLEDLSSANRSLVLSLESIRGVVVTPQGHIEVLAAVQIGRGLNMEGLLQLGGLATLSEEALLYVARATGVPIEALQGEIPNIILSVLAKQATFQIRLSRATNVGATVLTKTALMQSLGKQAKTGATISVSTQFAKTPTRLAEF